ncbi:MAG TPA: translation initiation factor IF-2 [Candidatus Krumholzibacteria bacterium]|nr:translation initiation factor IF-2 [Candidatus Krumholzibacteria bacterium]
MRIHELAKKYNVTSEELIALLKNSGHEVANHMSAVDYDMLAALDRHFSWANTATKKPARKTTARSKTAKAADEAAAPAAKAKVKLRKAKTVAEEPKPAANAEAAADKPKAKLSKAKAAEKTEASVETAARTAKTEKAGKSEKTEKADGKKGAGSAVRTEEAGKKPPKVKAKPSPLDELSGEPTEPIIAVEPDLGIDEPEWRGRIIEEPRRQAKEAEQVRESVRRRIAEMETTRKTKRRKTRVVQPEPSELPPVRVQEGVTPAGLAAAMGLGVDELLSRLASLDVEASPNKALERENIELIAEELGRTVEIEAVYGEMQLKHAATIDPAKLVHRAPVVVVMGHVDHGKTSILDYIRKARVAAGEAGGITQHVGAYEVETPGGKITFIDTPGHEAFTAMRARGARITDIVVLVVAADDGVMPQTIEAINHTLAARVPMIVAVNKSDLPAANPAQVKQQLMQYNVLVEDFGGEVVAVDVSAKTGHNIDKLLEMILLQAELADLKADPTAPAQGVVVEVRKEEGRGILLTILVQQGTLNVGDVFVVGNESGKVRSLFDHAGRAVRKAGPSMPVVVLGSNGMPEAGDEFIAVKDEREAREIAEKRQEAIRVRELQPTKALTLEDLYAQIQGGELKELNVVIKADTNGSIEALRESLSAQEIEGIKVHVMHAAVGSVSESDVLLAANTGGVIIAFSTKVSPKAKEIAKLKGVEIRSYKIIYEVLDDVDKALKGMLEPVFAERKLGHAEVRKLFKVSRQGTIAGCMVIDGTILRGAQTRVLRGEETVFTGRIGSLKRFQDDVREVAQNFECGITILGYDNLEEGDIIEAFVVEEKARVF